MPIRRSPANRSIRACRCRPRRGPRSPHGAPGDPHQLAHRGLRALPPPATPPCHRRQACARHHDAPTAPPPRSAHGQGSSPAAHRPPAPPPPCPNPGPATGADPHPGHTRTPCGHNGRSGAKHHFVAAPAPLPTCRRRRLPPRTPRTRCPRSRCAGRHPAAPAIASHCARRCPLLWFLTFDKPETLSGNDVRPILRRYPPTEVSQEPEKVANFGDDTPLGRAGQPAELAPVYVLLAADEGSYISGARVAVTGGRPVL